MSPAPRYFYGYGHDNVQPPTVHAPELGGYPFRPADQWRPSVPIDEVLGIGSGRPTPEEWITWEAKHKGLLPHIGRRRWPDCLRRA